jgi:hypothetical protein
MKSRTSTRVMAWLGLLMLLLSLSPAGMQVAAAQGAGLPVVEADIAQETESFLEVHVSTCEPGTTGTPQELRTICHDNGIAGAQMTVRSVDPALGIDQLKTTERVNGLGPGIINTGTIPAGEYRVEQVLPIQDATFVVGCEYFDRDESVPVNPANDQNFSVTVPQGEDIVCDLYVIPNPEAKPASLEITMHQCGRDALAGDGRTFEDLSGPCATVPTEPVELTLTDGQGGQTERALDANGTVFFDGLQPGNYSVFSDLDRTDWGEYLFCTLDGGERYEKSFDDRVVATFNDVSSDVIVCDWFAVRAPQEAPVENETDTPNDESTSTSPETPDDSGNDQGTDAQADVTPIDGTATLVMQVQACEPGYVPTTVDDPTFSADCPTPTGSVSFTMQAPDGTSVVNTSDDAGNVDFTGLLGDYAIFSNVPLEAATEYFFCSVDGGEVYQKEFDASGVSRFTNFLPDERVECSWYIVPENLRGDETGGTVTVHLSACPVGYAGSNWYNDCHANGVADMPFTLSGAATEITANTVIETTPGPGVVTFAGLPGGEFTLAGGPPQDFGSVVLYCSDPSTGERFDAPMDGGVARFTLAEQQSILCDWYFIPDDQGAPTPTPTVTPEPQFAEILVTMFECDPSSVAAGATFGDLDRQCQTPVNDVPVSLRNPDGSPLSAKTGVSGAGAVRFYELRSGDYVTKPALPSGVQNIAVFCQIGDGDVYQKPIQNGSTTFVDVDGEEIFCSWFVAKQQVTPPQPAGPSGSITVREFLCEGDKTSIKDWDRDCVPGTSKTSYTLNADNGAFSRNDAPNASGVLVFGELPDGYYELKQDTGVWCRAAAERVDSRSRVIVTGGQNTTVFLYQCNQNIGLPNTGSGNAGITDDEHTFIPLILAMLAIPLFAAAIWQHRRGEPETFPVRSQGEAGRRRVAAPDAQPEHTGLDRIRFR